MTGPQLPRDTVVENTNNNNFTERVGNDAMSPCFSGGPQSGQLHQHEGVITLKKDGAVYQG